VNYLGHLFLSNNRLEIMRPNLFGDFVKGNKFDHFPEIVVEGIRLHREIDSFIDNHPSVIDLLHVLYPKLPKVAGIAVDLYFDHILARDWRFYSDLTLTDFTLNFFSYEDKNEDYFSKEFKELLRIIEKGKWLINYETIDGLEFACKGLSSRISFENELKNGVNVFHENKDLIETTFNVFMKDAIKKFN
jgi:acyl carrier protein phosphodiesterase